MLAKGLRSPASCIFISVTEGLPARAFLSTKERLKNRGSLQSASQISAQGDQEHNLTQFVTIVSCHLHSAHTVRKIQDGFAMSQRAGHRVPAVLCPIGPFTAAGFGSVHARGQECVTPKTIITYILRVITSQIGIQYPFNHTESWGCGDAR